MNKPPSISETAFNCSHCGAYTTQHWWSLSADRVGKESDGSPGRPAMPGSDFEERIAEFDKLPDGERQRLIGWAKAMRAGKVFFDRKSVDRYRTLHVNNLHLSDCYNCGMIAIWVGERLVDPPVRAVPLASADLPDDIRTDYDEAAGILNASPRGAAAILRVCVEKLCRHLGQKGRLDDAIGAMVKSGLNPLVQQSLDSVRVIGNDAVHPGQIDARDMRDTALTLFSLVNLIAEQMITQPRIAHEVYEKLPAEKRAAIAKRDGNGVTG